MADFENWWFKVSSELFEYEKRLSGGFLGGEAFVGEIKVWFECDVLRYFGLVDLYFKNKLFIDTIYLYWGDILFYIFNTLNSFHDIVNVGHVTFD